MKFATSLRLLGELVSAADCDYNSFKDLVLICPHCKRSVYLIGAHQRSATTRHFRSGKTTFVRESSVVSHFTHHLADDDLCEIEDRSISPQVILHRATVARNQRASIFRDRFWKIFCSGRYMKSFAFGTDTEEFTKLIDSTVKTGTFAIMLRSVQQRFLVHTTCGLDPIEQAEKIPLIKSFHPKSSPLLEQVISAIHLKISPSEEIHLQYNSIQEAVLFLYAPANKKLLRRCLVALVVAIYTNKLVEECDRYLKTSFFRDTSIPDKDKASIIDRACLKADAIIYNDDVIQLSDDNIEVKISDLFVILIVCLISINWGFEFEKQYS